MRLWKRHALVITVILVVSVSAPLRLYGLNALPAGLYGDEAADGIDALQILAGERPLFLVENNGREALHAYLVALSVGFLGRTPAAVRLPSALASCATVLGIFLVARSLFKPRIGLIAALIAGFTVWPIMLGRLATRPALLPVFLTFGLWIGIESSKTKNSWRWILSGLVFGVAFYTYTPIRVIILALPVWAGILILVRQGQRLWPHAILFLAALVITVLPFANYALGNWDVVFGRTGGVSIITLTDSPHSIGATLWQQTATVLSMFFLPGHGDWNLRHNIPDRPVFDTLMAILFVTGLSLALQVKWRMKLLFCTLWAAIGLLPTILSVEAPHFARASSTLPVIFIWPALGLQWIYHHLETYTNSILSLTIASGILLGSIFITTRDYYLDKYLASPDAGFWFDEQCTQAALEINHFLGVGWQGEKWFAPPTSVPPYRQVLLAPNVCPQYSSSGYYTVRFIVPLPLGDAPELQRYDLSNLPTGNTLAREILFLAIPGDEAQILPWLPTDYTVELSDGPWTPPDKLGRSWLVYRTIRATSARD